MPPPVRRRGSGLLQIPRPRLLPSPCVPGLGPLASELSTRQGSPALRPAALLLLASTLGSPLTPEVDYRAPLAVCPGGTSTRWSIGPWLGARTHVPIIPERRYRNIRKLSEKKEAQRRPQA